MKTKLNAKDFLKRAAEMQTSFRGEQGQMTSEVFDIVKTLRAQGYFFSTILKLLKDEGLVKYKNQGGLYQAYYNKEAKDKRGKLEVKNK